MIKFKVYKYTGYLDEDGKIILDSTEKEATRLAKDMQIELANQIEHAPGYTPGRTGHMLKVVEEFGGKVLEVSTVVADEPLVN
jgi:hypothetical protein